MAKPVPEFADSNLSKLINIFLPVIIIYSHVSYNFAFDLGNELSSGKVAHGPLNADEFRQSLLSVQGVTPLHEGEKPLLASGRRQAQPQSCSISRKTTVK